MYECNEDDDISTELIKYTPEQLLRMRTDALERQRKREEQERERPLYCSFCGDERLVAKGPAVFICRSCAQLAIEVIEGGGGIRRRGDIK